MTVSVEVTRILFQVDTEDGSSDPSQVPGVEGRAQLIRDLLNPHITSNKKFDNERDAQNFVAGLARDTIVPALKIELDLMILQGDLAVLDLTFMQWVGKGPRSG